MYLVQIFNIQLELQAIIYVLLPFFFSRVNYIIDWVSSSRNIQQENLTIFIPD